MDLPEPNSRRASVPTPRATARSCWRPPTGCSGTRRARRDDGADRRSGRRRQGDALPPLSRPRLDRARPARRARARAAGAAPAREPPLGPGAPPAERLAAFYRALLDLLERHGHLALAAETGERRYVTGAYGAWALHVRTLVDEAGLGDQPALTDVLLAPLAPDVFAHQRAPASRPTRSPSDLAALAHQALRRP